jgi:23S rRNA (cytidine1920-2'-O)/16S rRNA (cytidine1409-2'-O)-methyltransferase
MARRRLSLRRLEDEVATRFPEITDPAAEIASGRIAADGPVAANPATRVRIDAAASRRVDVPLRGEANLRAALAAFSLDVTGRVALDCGAAADGFTRVLLAAGARRVYAVDAGFGHGVQSAGRLPLGRIRSPVPGSRGAVEHLIHARRL